MGYKISCAVYFDSGFGKGLTVFGLLCFVLWFLYIINNFNFSSLVPTILFIICSFYIPIKSIRVLLKNITVQEFNMAYNQNKLLIYSVNGHMQVEWHELFKVKEYKSFFIIYITPRIYYPVPKYIFDQASEQLKELKEIISSKCR